MRFNIKWKTLSVLAVLGLQLVSFQNCSSKVGYSSNSSAASIDSNRNNLSNNGEGYDGKTTYNHYDSQSPCPDALPNDTIEVRVNQAAMTRERCQPVAKAIPMSSLQFANDGTGELTYLGLTYNVHVAVAASCPSGTSGAPLGSIPAVTSFILPGRIEGENYDPGGEGLAYHDTTAGNMFGGYRTDDVDIGDLAGGSNGFAIGAMNPGEWLGYTVNVSETGTYALSISISGMNPSTVHLEVDGANVSGPINTPDTGSWTVYQQAVSGTFALTAGMHKVKIVVDGIGVNIDYLDFCR